MVDEAEYTELAKGRIRHVLDEHHATVALELEARISETRSTTGAISLDPHHVTAAVRELVASGELVRAPGAVRGGGEPIETIQPADQRKRITVIERTAARKRLLYARYRGWAQATQRNAHGLIGPAGEQATRAAILASGAVVPIAPDAGEVTRLLNVDLPGPLDSAGFIVPLVDGLPQPAVATLFEVKNIRGWIYPTSWELYQLLHKAAIVQRANLDQPVLPILVCRKAHATTFKMARQLGFMIIATEVQYAGNVKENALDEVRIELAFSDLRAGVEPMLRVRDRLQNTARTYSLTSTEKWKSTVTNPDMFESITALRVATSAARRAALMAGFRAEAETAGYAGGW